MYPVPIQVDTNPDPLPPPGKPDPSLIFYGLMEGKMDPYSPTPKTADDKAALDAFNKWFEKVILYIECKVSFQILRFFSLQKHFCVFFSPKISSCPPADGHRLFAKGDI